VKKYLLFFFLVFSVMCFSINYDIDAEFLPGSHEIAGSISVNTDGYDPVFLLYPNFNSKPNKNYHEIVQKGRTSIKIVSVLDKDGSPVDYSLESYADDRYYDAENRENTVLRVKGPAGKYNIKFVTEFSNQFSQEECGYDDFYSWRFAWYPMLLKEQKGLYYLAHTWTLRMKAPKNWMVVTGGEKHGDVWKSDGSYQTCPLAFLDDKDYRCSSVEGKDMNYEVYFRKGLQSEASILLSYVQKSITYHTKNYGKLRYKTIRIVQDPYPGLYGMAADGFIMIGDGMFTTANLWIPGFLDPLMFYLVAHECAHMWFGIGAGVDFTSDNFLSESLAEFSAQNAMRDVYGSEDYMNWDLPSVLAKLIEFFNTQSPETMPEYTQELLLSMHRSGVTAAVSDSLEKIPQNYASNVYYQKGSRAFWMLQDYLGKERLFNILGEYYRKYDGKLVSYDDFKNFLSGYVEPEIIKDLFETRDDFDPKLKVNSSGVISLDMGSRTVPVEVEINGFDGASETIVATHSMILNGTGGMTAIRSVDVDPNFHTYDIERHNNHYPLLFEYPYMKKHSYFDAYTMNLENSMSMGGYYIFSYKGILSLSKYPYWSAGMIYGNYIYDDFYSNVDNYYGANIKLNPSNKFSMDVSYDTVHGLYGETTYNFMQKIKTSGSLYNYDSKFALTVDGQYLNNKNYYFGGALDFDDFTYKGFDSTLKYKYMESESYDENSLDLEGSYFFNVDQLLQPYVDAEVAYDMGGNKSINPFESCYSLLMDDEYLPTSESGDYKYYSSNLLSFSAGLSLKTELSKRINVLNVISLAGVNSSLEIFYKHFDNIDAAGCLLNLGSKAYVLGDTPLILATAIGYFYVFEDNNYSIYRSSKLTLGASVSLGL
jgi:hypothetical protein